MTTRIIDTNTDVVLCDVRAGVGVITLNRPERRNALNAEMYPAIRSALTDFASADDVGCVVITGAGAGFCAGGDVQAGRVRAADEPRPSVAESAEALCSDAQVSRLLHEHPKVTIAAVNGGAVGAGLAIALSCDLRIMAQSAKFISGWGPLAFSGDFGGAWFLTQLVGRSKALELLISNETVSADAALEMGLTNRVVSSEKFPEVWREWAESIAALPPQATRYMKLNVRDALDVPLADALRIESLRMAESARTDEHRDAVRTWLAARRP